MVCPSQISRDGGLSVADLSPHNSDALEVFVLFKIYFDGGNDPNSIQHRWVTLSAIFSNNESLRSFATDWKCVLANHSVDYLHTTDAVRAGQHDLLWDCAGVIEDHVVRDDTWRGIIPVSVTIDAREFRTVRDEVPDGPQILSEVLAGQGLDRVIWGARQIARRLGQDDTKTFYSLFYDRGEPYRGHVEDKFRNPLFRKNALRSSVDKIDVDRYVLIHPPLDSRDFPELQAADLFSWCYNHRRTIQFEWHLRVMDTPSDAILLDRKALLKPIARSTGG